MRKTLHELLGDAKYLSVRLGIIATLHTWSQTLVLHPHVHCLVTGGGRTPGGQWVAVRHGFPLPARVVMAVFRGKLLAAIRQERLELFVAKQGGANAVLHYGRKRTAEISAVVSISSELGKGAYSFSLIGAMPDELIFDREELVRERAQQLAEEAARAFLADIEQGGDPAERATTHGGHFNPAAWVTRTDMAVPTEVLSAAFGMPKADSAAPQREVVALANGGQAVIVLTGVEAGEPSSMTQAERDQRQAQLADQAARAELTGYVGSIREKATVRIPDEILNPPLF